MAGESETFTKEQVDELLAQRIAQEVQGLKSQNQKLLDELKPLKAKATQFSGIDPEEYQRLREEHERREREDMEKKGQWDALQKQLIDKHQQREKELLEKHGADAKDWESKQAKLTRTLEQALIDAEFTRAIAGQKGVPDLLLPVARQYGRLRETDDGFEAYLADPKTGNPLIADGKGTPMTFDLFVEKEMKPKFARAFDGTGSNGGGASKSNGGAGGARTVVAGDNAAFIANLKEIASGKAEVTMGD